MSKKIKFIFGVTLSLIVLGGCEKSPEDNITETSAVSVTMSETETSAAVTKASEETTVSESEITEAADTSVSEREEVSEEQAALEQLIIDTAENKEGYTIQSPLFGDFDGDGINEIISIFGTRGEVWFASGDKTYKLFDRSSMNPWGEPYILKTSGQTILCIWDTMPGTLGGTETSTYCFRIKNSKIKEIKTDDTVSDIYGVFGDFIGTDTTGGDLYIEIPDNGNPHGNGTTYKDYWYYYIDDKILGYYGNEITEEEFLKYNGAKDFLDNIKKDGYNLDGILKRGNGVINVNFSNKSYSERFETTYISIRHKTFFYRNGKLIDYGTNDINDGVYEQCIWGNPETSQTDFERFSEMIYDTAEGDENSFIRERFYGNIGGKNALYAYYGTDENFSLWYADKDGAKKVTENISLFYADGDVLMKNGDDYFVIKNGKSKRLDGFKELGAKDITVQEDGSFTGYVKAGYADSTRSEETKMLYWFCYRGGEITEYTGLDITEDELLEYGGGRAALDEIAARGGDLVNIVRRDNGIININYALHNQTVTKRFFMTLEVGKDNKLTDITPKNEDGTPDNAGWYLHSLKI